MILKFVTKNGTKVYGPPYTKQEEADFYQSGHRNLIAPCPASDPKRTSQSPYLTTSGSPGLTRYDVTSWVREGQ